ncbi:MAG TPA: hypothetical protein VFC30_00510 [Solirubrobacteraceae bacterium]|nr:hypothetical protein [Solirubrobacteraceae bacterium]
MSRVLIVSKTRMRGDHVCIGGHNLDESMRSIRLLQPDGTNMPARSVGLYRLTWRVGGEDP